MNYVVQNNWVFDTNRLKKELKEILEEFNINDHRIGGLHGIGISTQDGTIYGGFKFNVGVQDPPYLDQDFTDMDPKVYFNLDFCRENQIYHMINHNIRTSACRGYFAEIMDFLEEKGMNPRRARLSYLPPEGIIDKHTDGNFHRFHIPIVSPEGTDFVHGNVSYLLEEGKSYLANVHPYHYVVNRGSYDRWHFVADVWDTQGNFSIGKISQEHFEQELKNGMLWKDYVDGKRDSPNKILVGVDNASG